MKKIVAIIVSLAVAVAAVLDGYWMFFTKKATTATTGNVEMTASSSASSTSSSSSSSTSSNNQASYKDGTYTGTAISTQWGDVQVQVTVSAGKITDVKALEYPDDNNRSQQINEEVLPEYKEEAIKANSAKIQAISGATVTYGGYTSSLQSALDQAV